jgi:hypothetical protein
VRDGGPLGGPIRCHPARRTERTTRKIFGQGPRRSHWLVLPAEELLHDRTADQPPVTIELRTGDQPLVIETVDGEAHARPGKATNPDLVLAGPHRVIVRLMAGRLDVADA